jgi:hypothetical protein
MVSPFFVHDVTRLRAGKCVDDVLAGLACSSAIDSAQ